MKSDGALSIQPLPIATYQNIVILTGAGVSAASGLGTYRGPGGLWTQLDVARIADADNLPGTLPDLWRLYSRRRRAALDAEPNAAHYAIANLQRQHSKTRNITLVTQNVDGLHQRSGSTEAIELHGSAFRSRCYNPTCLTLPFRDETVPEEGIVPTCTTCDAPLRPDVVLFSEQIPKRAMGQIVQALAVCDLFVSVGTSGVVWPASDFVRVAATAGARTLYVNLEPIQPRQPAFQEEYIGRAEEILPLLFGQINPM